MQERIYNEQDISCAFRDCGIADYEIILAHSSLKSFGRVDGGAETVVSALLGMKNTVLFPAFTGKITDSKYCPPIMNVVLSPTWTGAIPETARKFPGAIRSLHPTHSLTGFGCRAEELLNGHENTQSPCDKNSPFYKLVENDGGIILFGCDHNSNTMVHCCEEISGVDYHLQSDFTDGVVEAAARRVIVVNRLHDWQKPPTDFNKIEQLLIAANAINFAKVGESFVRIISARKLFDTLCGKLLADGNFLLL